MMKKAVIEGTGEALEAMVFPKFVSIDDKFKKIDKNFEELRSEVRQNSEAIAKVERKLDKITDHQAEKLDDHERRIEKIELSIAV